jgi:hypothetical protein
VGTFAGWNRPPKYTMKITYMKVDDTFEPNDTRDTAKPITLGTPVTPSFTDGFISATSIDDEDVRDWYTWSAPSGNLTAKVESVPMT